MGGVKLRHFVLSLKREEERIFTVELYRKVRQTYFRQGLNKHPTASGFGISRETADKMVAYSVPPGYRRSGPVGRPKLNGFTALIEQWSEEASGGRSSVTRRGGSSSGCATSTDSRAATRL